MDRFNRQLFGRLGSVPHVQPCAALWDAGPEREAVSCGPFAARRPREQRVGGLERALEVLHLPPRAILISDEVVVSGWVVMIHGLCTKVHR